MKLFIIVLLAMMVLSLAGCAANTPIVITSTVLATINSTTTVTTTQPAVTIKNEVSANPVTQTITITQPALTVTTTVGGTTSSPTTSSPPTANPSSSRSNPTGLNIPLQVNVGSTGRKGTDYSVRVNLVQFIRGDAAWQMVLARNQFNSPPDSGNEYILAKLHLDYLSGATADTTYEAVGQWFVAVSTAGKDYDHSLVVDPDPQFDAVLYPGASSEGWVTFQISKTDTKPLLAFGRDYNGTGGIWFKLY